MDTFMATCHRLLGQRLSNPASPNQAEDSDTPPFNFLALPLDLRLEIYICINDRYTSRPWESPLYPFLSVNQQVRVEVGQIFYRASGFVFTSPSRCMSFLNITATHLHLLNSLTISVPDGDTHSLEPIFRKLVEANAPVDTLVLDLQCRASKHSKSGEWGSVREEVGAVALSEARERAQNLEKIYERSVRHKTDISEGASFAEDPRGLWLGKLETIRFLSIDGNPFGDWKTEFELGVLTVHARMFEIAKTEGQMTLQKPAWYGRWGDWYWFGSAELVKRNSLPESMLSLISVM